MMTLYLLANLEFVIGMCLTIHLIEFKIATGIDEKTKNMQKFTVFLREQMSSFVFQFMQIDRNNRRRLPDIQTKLIELMTHEQIACTLHTLSGNGRIRTLIVWDDKNVHRQYFSIRCLHWYFQHLWMETYGRRKEQIRVNRCERSYRASTTKPLNFSWEANNNYVLRNVWGVLLQVLSLALSIDEYRNGFIT